MTAETAASLPRFTRTPATRVGLPALPSGVRAAWDPGNRTISVPAGTLLNASPAFPPTARVLNLNNGMVCSLSLIAFLSQN